MLTAAGPRSFDAVIIGAGHNGLVAAAYLARAGLTVLVLERREMVGGAAVTEEILPGFKCSRAAYVLSLFRAEIIRELRLADHGFSVIPRNPSSFTPLLDGRFLLLGPDPGLNHREIKKFSARDAEAFPQYEATLDRITRFVEPVLDMAPPDLAATGWKERAETIGDLARLVWRAVKLGRDLLPLLEMCVIPASRILDRWFESEPLKSTLATDAIIGAMASPSTPGSGYVLLHHVMGQTDGVRGVWGYVRGGMGSLAQAIAGAARAHGATILTGHPVAKILTEAERAMGVILEDGTTIRARVVLSSADPKVTFLNLLPAESLPGEFRDRISSMDFSSGVTKINVALDRLPSFTAHPGHAPGPQHYGTIHLVSAMEEIEGAYRDALVGRPSTRPVIEMTLPSSLDPTLAPPGKHVMSLFVQYTPYTLAQGTWDEPGIKDAFADRVFRVIEEFAPGFTTSVLARDILSPLDLERIFGLTGGNIFHGAMRFDQLFWLRPAPGWSRYRTPIENLYLCGAGAHPGGGIIGAAGRNAALAVLADLRRFISPRHLGHSRVP
ncbi:MAG: FAD dependent oxidoreductase [candidate division NC10 bacterium CSP1-5]|nr:MAG: FAD dependent oxidoreductase [candidate division NC10 bacterium CSP1-5]